MPKTADSAPLALRARLRSSLASVGGVGRVDSAATPQPPRGWVSHRGNHSWPIPSSPIPGGPGDAASFLSGDHKLRISRAFAVRVSSSDVSTASQSDIPIFFLIPRVGLTHLLRSCDRKGIEPDRLRVFPEAIGNGPLIILR